MSTHKIRERLDALRASDRLTYSRKMNTETWYNDSSRRVTPSRRDDTAGHRGHVGAQPMRYSDPMIRAYDEIVDFIAGGTTPDAVARFGPSDETRRRVADLIHREKTSGLTPDETSELDHYVKIEHLMRLAKARARALCSHE
jgi:hypothetical protein